MDKKLVHLILLLSLLFNISHAFIIENDCDHETIQQYIMEQTHKTDCGDLCDIHYIFHFVAILDNYNSDFTINHYRLKTTYTFTPYLSPLQEKSIKPPIV